MAPIYILWLREVKRYSRNRIAGELNRQKVPTPRRRRWDHSSVRNVLLRLHSAQCDIVHSLRTQS